MNATTSINISQAFEEKETLRREELVQWLSVRYPGLSDRTLYWRIFDLNSRGLLESPGRGIYRLSSRRAFSPSPATLTKRLARLVKKEFPLLDTRIWETRWVSGWMELQPAHNWTIVETEKEGVDMVFACLSDRFSHVFHDPDPKVVDLYILPLHEAILVKPLVSEAPLLQIGELASCGPEKILVDIAAEPELFRAQQGELEGIFENAFREITINQSRMRRYARRRNKLETIRTLMPPAYRLPPADKAVKNDK